MHLVGLGCGAGVWWERRGVCDLVFCPMIQGSLEENCDKVTQDGGMPTKKIGFQNKEEVSIKNVAGDTGLQEINSNAQ